MFQKAVRKQSKLRLALVSPSGGGKTYSALKLAKGLGGKIAVIDTEQDSASLYADICDFDVKKLSAPYTPEKYIDAINEAAKLGYDVLIIDSTTHEWSGVGGCLEINDMLAKARYRGNTWSAWNETTPRHRKFIDTILQCPMHVITTARSKTDTIQEKVGDKTKVVKVGMKTEQRDGFEYEFTVVLELSHDGHFAIASKDRTGLFLDPHVISEETGKRLNNWLNTGIELKPEPPRLIDDNQCENITTIIKEIGADLNAFLGWLKVEKISELPAERYNQAIEALDAKKRQQPPPPLPPRRLSSAERELGVKDMKAAHDIAALQMILKDYHKMAKDIGDKESIAFFNDCYKECAAAFD
jgi:hypothetical protein